MIQCEAFKSLTFGLKFNNLKDVHVEFKEKLFGSKSPLPAGKRKEAHCSPELGEGKRKKEAGEGKRKNVPGEGKRKNVPGEGKRKKEPGEGKRKNVPGEGKRKKIEPANDGQSLKLCKSNVIRRGSDIPVAIEEFSDLADLYGVDPLLIENIASLNFVKPTPIQCQAIPCLLSSRQLLACAPTGSGKTLAFLIPLIHHLLQRRLKCSKCRAIILAPTRELVTQIRKVFAQITDGLSLVCGALEMKSYDVLVTTPNKLIFALKEGSCTLDMKCIDWLIIDESDKLFEDGSTGFRDQLAFIYNKCATSKKAMFSATYAYEVERWCRQSIDGIVQIFVGVRNVTCHSVTQELQYVGSEAGKLVAIRKFLKTGFKPPVLVFVQSADRARQLYRELAYEKVHCEAMHSNLSQEERSQIIEKFEAGSIWVLICTDVLGRGIDFKGVNLVINYDFPNSAISYIHRIGRTGRAGAAGRAVTYFSDIDGDLLRCIAGLMQESGCHVPEYMLRLHRPSKKDRRKMARRCFAREDISVRPTFSKKQKMQRKQKLMAKQKILSKKEIASKCTVFSQKGTKKYSAGNSSSRKNKKAEKRKKQNNEK